MPGDSVLRGREVIDWEELAILAWGRSHDFRCPPLTMVGKKKMSGPGDHI